MEKGARVRLLDLLRLGVEVLVRPALRLDLGRDWRAELALGVLAPHRLGRGLVAVEPLARPLDLAARIVLLDADARLDGHELGVRLHLVGHAREVGDGLLCRDLVEPRELLLERLGREHLLLLGVDRVGPRGEALLDDQPLLARRADPLVALDGGDRAAVARVLRVVEGPEGLVLEGVVDHVLLHDSGLGRGLICSGGLVGEPVELVVLDHGHLVERLGAVSLEDWGGFGCLDFIPRVTPY